MQRQKTAESLSRDELRAAREMLMARLDDKNDFDALMRTAAAAMVRHCCEVYDKRDDVGPGWLVAALRAGGTWERTQRRENASDLLRALNGEEA